MDTDKRDEYAAFLDTATVKRLAQAWADAIDKQVAERAYREVNALLASGQTIREMGAGYGWDVRALRDGD